MAMFFLATALRVFVPFEQLSHCELVYELKGKWLDFLLTTIVRFWEAGKAYIMENPVFNICFVVVVAYMVQSIGNVVAM
ncbi:hypothetical protein CYMTET_53290 [Cymbomonas tetramitiformis]|uniref:Uncharacterized protein n=1 Tax=Cymbomonas tetramitiformis TaxID=36881 RepID=A0AAE0BH74_9CHLO|nr:hypothetical protein CYMTET_53290 [Cymbomonas tetramitiformis]